MAVEPKSSAQRDAFAKALRKFTREDPTLRLRQDPESGQTLLSGMGELHLQVSLRRMSEEFGCEIVSGTPRVQYRETITRRADFDCTLKEQHGGQGQFARIAGYFEPLDARATQDFEFVNAVSGGTIPSDRFSTSRTGLTKD